MSNQQILEQAIQKAIDGRFYSFAYGAFGKPEFVVGSEDRFGHTKVWVKDWPDEWVSAEYIIFSHDFAKAIFGSDMQNGQPKWRNALQYMVVQDDPIEALGRLIDDYLGEHLDGDSEQSAE